MTPKTDPIFGNGSRSGVSSQTSLEARSNGPNSANVRRHDFVPQGTTYNITIKWAELGQCETPAGRQLAKIEVLEKKLQEKKEVMAELLQEHVQLKNANGAP